MSTQIIVDGGGSTVTVSGSVTVVSSGGRPLLGGGVPVGGTAGQSLVKASDDDYDTEWMTVSGGLGGGSGTVTSVGLSLPAIFSLTGSPVTAAGTFTVTLATQTANRVFAGPTSGSAAAPTFRALVAADVPDLSATYATAAALTTTNATVASNTTAIAGKQASATGLTSLSGLTGAGYVKETATGVFALVASVPWADVSSKPANVTAIAAVSGTGYLRQNHLGVWGFVNAVRTITADAGLGLDFQFTLSQDGDNSFNLTLSDAAALLANLGLDSLADVAFSGSAADLGAGTLPDARLANVVTAGGPVGSSSVVPVITYDAHGRLITVSTATITPAAIGAAALAGATFTGPVTLQSGLTVSSSFTLTAPDLVAFKTANQFVASVDVNGYAVRDSSQYLFSSVFYSYGTPDTGLARDSAGVVRVTDGSAGTGELIVSALTLNGTRYTSLSGGGGSPSSGSAGYVQYSDGAGGFLAEAAFSYNASTNTLTADTFAGALSGNASTATALATGRAINGVTFDGTAAITVTAAAGTLTGTTLAGTVVTSSLTSVGVLTGGTWTANVIGSLYGGTGADLSVANGIVVVTSGVFSATASIGAGAGGTGQTGYVVGNILYASGGTALSKLAPNTSATMAVLTMAGTGSAGQAPVWTSTTGTGNVVRATSPTFVTPLLGTPTSGTLTNCTGLPAAGATFAADNRVLARSAGSAGAGQEVALDASMRWRSNQPAAGGPMTALGTTGTVSVDLNTSNRFKVTPTAAVTLTFDNTQDDDQFTVIVGSSAYSVTWPSGIKWTGGAAPSQPPASGHRLVCAFRRHASGDYDGFYSDNS